MDRRSSLKLGGAALGAGVVGYVAWDWYTSPSIPSKMSVKSRHVVGEVFEHNKNPHFSDSERTQYAVPRREIFYTRFADADTAAELVMDEEPKYERRFDPADIVAFLDEVDFSREILVIIQTGGSSDRDYELEAIERTREGLTIELDEDRPRQGVDDIITHSFLLQIRDKRNVSPAIASVDIDFAD